MEDGRITVNPAVCFGKPCIRGTRIPVYMVLELVEQGLRPEDIIRQCYPELTPEDIRACLHYASHTRIHVTRPGRAPEVLH